MPYAGPSPTASVPASPTTLTKDLRGPPPHANWGSSAPQSWSGTSSPPLRPLHVRNHARTHNVDNIPSRRHHEQGDSVDSPGVMSPAASPKLVSGTSPPSSFISVQPATPLHGEAPRLPTSSRVMFTIGADPLSPPPTVWPEGDHIYGHDHLPLVETGSSWSAAPPAPLKRTDSAPVGGNLLLHGAAARSGSGGTNLRMKFHRSSASTASVPTASMSNHMLRKKSGELVRSSLKGSSAILGPIASVPMSDTRLVRSKSVPTTPTGPKAVHFDANLNQVKTFESRRAPSTVSRQGSNEDTETETEAESYPFPAMSNTLPNDLVYQSSDIGNEPGGRERLKEAEVRLETVAISTELCSLRGTILVKNLAFHKRVAVRFTVDSWQTTSEVSGEYASELTASEGQIERWKFTIKLQDWATKIETTKLLLAIRYEVSGKDLWDNNGGRNYTVEFRRKPSTRRSASESAVSTIPKYQWSVTTPNQAAERMAVWRRSLTKLVDSDPDDGAEDDPDSPIAPYQRPTGQASSATWSNRYDFGASFKRPSASASAASSKAALLKNPYFHSESGLDSPSASPGGSTYVSPRISNSLHLVGGMPATTCSPLLPPTSYFTPPTSATSHVPPSLDGSSASTSASSSATSSPPVWSHVDGDMPFPVARVEVVETSLSNDLTPRGTRFNSYPPSRGPRLEHHALLSPAGLGRLSPAHSPLSTPQMDRSPMSTPPVPGSPVARTKPTPGSPPPLVSPSSTDSTTHSSPSSPMKEDSNGLAEDRDDGNRTPSGNASTSNGYFEPPSYSNFLERYCWAGSALGLTTGPTGPLDYPRSQHAPSVFKADAISPRSGTSAVSEGAFANPVYFRSAPPEPLAH